VACQRDQAGALVLSEFAGAAADMGEAFVVNPYDEDRTAATLEAVLATPEEERRARMAALSARVRRNNVFAWAVRFLESLRQAVAGRGDRERPALLPAEETACQFTAAQRRLLMLDYDGTLVPFARTPREAVPPRGLAEVLDALVRADRGAVCLISVARAPTFPLVRREGPVAGGQHGALVHRPGGGWEPLRSGVDAEWKARVRPVLEHFVDRTPGSFIEKRLRPGLALPPGRPRVRALAGQRAVLHAGADAGRDRAARGARAPRGGGATAWANKGRRAGVHGAALAGRGLPAGHRRRPHRRGPVRPDARRRGHRALGPGASRARFGLPDPPAVRRFLERLAQASQAPARPHADDLAFGALARNAI
jgi:hypothetical protein